MWTAGTVVVLKLKSTPRPVTARILLDHAVLVGEDRVGRAQLARQLEPLGHEVDRDDPLRADQPRRHHRRQADAADAEHRDACRRSRP